MKKIFAWALPFVAGVLFFAVLDCNTGCEKILDIGGSGNNPDDSELNIDHKGIIKIGKEAEKVFLNGNIENLKELLTEESLEYFEERLSNQTSQELKDIGEAFKSRTISYEGEQFAEYTYTHEGLEYTMTFWAVEDKEWKLVRY